jgi:Flp pilus assembly protein TadG
MATARSWATSAVWLATRSADARTVRGRTRASALVEFALTAAVFFGMLFAVGDFSLWIHAQNAATGAAQLAAASAARENGTADAAQQAGQSFLRSALGQSAGQLRVTVEITSDVASATADGSWTVSPLGERMTVPILARATVTRERFRPGGA